MESVLLDLVLMPRLFFLCGLFVASLCRADDLLIIASPQVPESAITIEQLAEIFTLKKTYWTNDVRVVPVNREASSAERERFSDQVFSLTPQELGEYWNRLRFQGKLPPLIQTSDQAVLSFVRSVPGAIGYIKGDQKPQGVKILLHIR